jgi:hypothetical protein
MAARAAAVQAVQAAPLLASANFVAAACRRQLVYISVFKRKILRNSRLTGYCNSASPKENLFLRAFRFIQPGGRGVPYAGLAKMPSVTDTLKSKVCAARLWRVLGSAPLFPARRQEAASTDAAKGGLTSCGSSYRTRERLE